MPSVKSYQNRKAEIISLKKLLAEAEYQERKAKADKVIAAENSRQEVNLFKQRLATSEECRNNLFRELQATKCQRDLDRMSLEFVQKSDSQIIDALHNKVQELERKIKIYRDYIRYGEAFYPEHFTAPIEPPACLKPLDTIKWFNDIRERL
jgi:hypothetical protein